LRMDGRVTTYAVGVEDLSRVAEVKANLERALGDDFEVRGWDELFPLLKELHGYQDAVFNLLSAVFLLVVLLGIVNSMLMSVLERVREIGTMMAVGVRRSQVARLFVLEGSAIGLSGSAIGAAAGAAAVFALRAAELSVPLAGSNAPSTL